MTGTESQRVDVTVIGGGPCGLFAAFYAGLRGMTVRIIDSLPELGGQLTALYPEKYVYDMPGFPKVLAKDLARELIAQGTQFNPELALDETAASLTEEDEGLHDHDPKRQGAADADDHHRRGRGRVPAHEDRRAARGGAVRQGRPLRRAATRGFSRTRRGRRRRRRLGVRLGAHAPVLTLMRAYRPSGRRTRLRTGCPCPCTAPAGAACG